MGNSHGNSFPITGPQWIHLHYCTEVKWCGAFNTLRPKQNGRHFPDDIFKRIFLNENVRISIKISLKFAPKVPINDISSLVQIMAWYWTGDKPLSEPMMVSLLMHICVTRPQWVNTLNFRYISHHFKDGIFKCIFWNRNVWISIRILLKFVPKIPMLVQWNVHLVPNRQQTHYLYQ